MLVSWIVDNNPLSGYRITRGIIPAKAFKKAGHSAWALTLDKIKSVVCSLKKNGQWHSSSAHRQNGNIRISRTRSIQPAFGNQNSFSHPSCPFECKWSVRRRQLEWTIIVCRLTGLKWFWAQTRILFVWIILHYRKGTHSMKQSIWTYWTD